MPPSWTERILLLKSKPEIQWWRFIVIGLVSWGTVGIAILLTVIGPWWATAIAGGTGVILSLLVARSLLKGLVSKDKS